MSVLCERLKIKQVVLCRSLNLGLVCLLIVLIFNETCSAQRRPKPPRRSFPRINKIIPMQPLPIPIPPPVFAPLSPGSFLGSPAVTELPVDQNAIMGLMQGDLRFEITEIFLQKFLNRKQQDSGAVQDFILGAQVTGQQTTLSNVSIDCLPSRSGARFNFEIQGTVQTSTTAFTPRATIAQQGNSQFRATKPVLFDGSKLLTKKATLLVMPNQKVLGAQTRHSRMPLLGPLANQIALGAAIAHTPQSNLIAGQKLIRKLQPRIDTQTDQNLKLVNKTLKEKVWDRLEQIKMVPVRQSAFSTDKKLYSDFQFSSQPVKQSIPKEIVNDDVSLSIHEQFFVGLLANHKLAGKRISLNKIVEQSNIILQLVDASFIDNPNKLPIEVHITYAEKTPLTISFQNNQIELIFRGKFQLQNLPVTETQRVRLTFNTQLNETELVVSSDVIDVREELPDGTLAEPGFTQRAFVTQFETLLRTVHIQRENLVPVHLSEAGVTSIAVRLKQLNVNANWLQLSWDIARQKSEPFSPTLAQPVSPAQVLPLETSPAEQIPLKFPEQIINP